MIVPENANSVLSVTATDADSADVLTYSIVGGPDAAVFTINAATGTLQFVNNPNFENPADSLGNNVYDIIVQVMDQAGGIDIQNLSITITDVNEHPFFIGITGFTFAESVANGAPIGFIQAADVDAGDSITYAFAPGGNPGGVFAIDPLNGQLTIANNSSIDFAVTPTYSIVVRVTDSLGLSADQVFVLSVIDVNQAPTITSNGGGVTASFDHVEGTTLATTVAALDPDVGNSVSYSIVGGADASKFSINAATGALTFNAAPVYGVPTDADLDGTYEVVVQATDGTLSDTQSLSIRVVDQNDPPERALNAELDDHIEGEAAAGKPNRRNGFSKKTVLTETSKLDLRIPRDREGSFDPKLIARYQRRFPGFDTKIISMYARGMSVREIQGHLMELYGLDVSPDLISTVTDAVMETVAEWQNRPLETSYPLVFFDAMRVKIRDEGLVRNKAVYLALGVQADGTKDILGIWIETTEGAKFWLRVMNELKSRGVEDILITVVDGLKGFPEAINAVFPQALVQTCIVHLIRHSLEFVSWKDRKPLVPALREIYRAKDADAGLKALEAFEAGDWGKKYPAITGAWRRNWDRVIPFFAFPEAVRKIIYTTNAIEGKRPVSEPFRFRANG